MRKSALIFFEESPIRCKLANISVSAGATLAFSKPCVCGVTGGVGVI